MTGQPTKTKHSTRAVAATDGACERRRITVHGIVQGVGFRPFVNRLARAHGLGGTVNNFTGGVGIEIEGPPHALDAFIDSLRREPPPIAVIERVLVERAPPIGQTGFVITPSAQGEGGPILVSPDAAICADCARELRDPDDRRYKHPFINCTNCGPRFTIIGRVPYDRPFTSMASFAMCPQCAREYEDIDDRRYHAQPVACPECGPTLELIEPGHRRASSQGPDALRRTRDLLAEGRIVAVKGLGGFHLACDADNQQAVALLRRRKGREEKPFAVMVASMDVARGIAHINEDAARLLHSPQSPIVLAAKAGPDRLAPGVAPDSADYGILLPYTPVHMLLFEGAPFRALIMTSANLSDEPLCTDNQEARRRLGDIADAFLLHDREILVGCDDSVLRISSRGPIIMRRARGYVPFPVKLHRHLRTVLAVGAQLKNTFCITSGQNAFLSQHMGDLDDADTLEFFEDSVAHLQDILQVNPDAIACDLHPDYMSTRYAREFADRRGLPLIETQHHHAHIASCLADNHHDGRVIGLACDGAGLGDDGTIWGCEVLVCDTLGYRRAGRLRNVPLPGGDAATRNPWRSALAYLWACELDAELQWLRGQVARDLPEDEWNTVEAMLERSLNCPPASSAGRLFDAVSAILGLRRKSAYEGQAAIALEAAASPTVGSYQYAIRDHEILVMDPAPLLSAIIADARSGVPISEISGRFHNTFAAMIVDCAVRIAQQERITHVALSGGTFQNRLLLSRVCDLLEERGITPLHHQSVPPNDGGIALGQAAIANARLAER